jgi:hypothetical protein
MALLPYRCKVGSNLLDAHPYNSQRMTMTPKDKAKELVDKFTLVGLQQRNEGIQCALIMCDELLCNSTFLISTGESYFWNEVKKEIELIGNQFGE